MAWDYRDQLRATTQQVVTNGGTPETTYYAYDGSGQRVRKITERQAAAGQTPVRKEERLYLGGFEVFRQYEGDGETIKLARETLHVMDDPQRIAMIETRTQGTDGSPRRRVRFQLGNHLGSAVLEVDDQAQVLSYEEYFPYGSTSYQAVRKDIEVPLKRYRYTGMERDEENGLNYHGARYYAPWLGRWIGPDPSGIEGGINLYEYGKGRPSVLVDTEGMAPKKKGTSLGASGSEQSMGTNMHFFVLAGLVVRAQQLGLDANFEMPTLPGGSRNKKDVGSADLVIRSSGVRHFYDLKKAGSSTSATTRWLKNYAKYYPSQPAILGTILKQNRQILAPIFYSDPAKPGGAYVIELSLATKGAVTLPGIIEYQYQFIKNSKFTREFQKQFVESRGFAFEPETMKTQMLKQLKDMKEALAKMGVEIKTPKAKTNALYLKAKEEHEEAVRALEWEESHTWFDKIFTSYEKEKRYRAEKEKHRDWEVKPNIILNMTDFIVKRTPSASRIAFMISGGFSTAGGARSGFVSERCTCPLFLGGRSSPLGGARWGYAPMKVQVLLMADVTYSIVPG